VARLEHEVAAVAQGGVYGRERGAQIVIGDETLERVSGHRGEIEAVLPPRVRCRARDPLDAGPAPGPV
jgi:hypothetical protein